MIQPIQLRYAHALVMHDQLNIYVYLCVCVCGVGLYTVKTVDRVFRGELA